MSITIAPWAVEIIKIGMYFAAGWVAGSFMRWLNKETRN